MNRAKAKNHYDFKIEFKTSKDKVVYQDFGLQNDSISLPHLDSTSMSQPPLDSTPLGINTTNRTTSPSDSVPVRKTFPKAKPLTSPMDSPSLPTGLPGGPDPDPSLSYSLNKYN